MTTAELEPASTKATSLGTRATMKAIQPGSRFQSSQTSSSIITNI